MPKKLTLSKIEEISLVTAGANQHADVVVFKSSDNPDTSQGDFDMSDSSEQLTLEKAQEEIDFLKKSLETTSKEVDSLKIAKAEAEEALKAATTEEAPDEAPSLPAEVQKQLDDAVEKAEKAEARIQKMEDEAQQTLYLAKAQSVPAFAGESTDDLAGIWKRIAVNKASPEDIVKLETMIKAANTAIEKGLLTSAGTDTPGDATGAAAQLDSIAKSLAKDLNITFAQAHVKATEENPALYEQYLSEQH